MFLHVSLKKFNIRDNFQKFSQVQWVFEGWPDDCGLFAPVLIVQGTISAPQIKWKRWVDKVNIHLFIWHRMWPCRHLHFHKKSKYEDLEVKVKVKLAKNKVLTQIHADTSKSLWLKKSRTESTNVMYWKSRWTPWRERRRKRGKDFRLSTAEWEIFMVLREHFKTLMIEMEALDRQNKSIHKKLQQSMKQLSKERKPLSKGLR